MHASTTKPTTVNDKAAKVHLIKDMENIQKEAANAVQKVSTSKTKSERGSSEKVSPKSEISPAPMEAKKQANSKKQDVAVEEESATTESAPQSATARNGCKNIRPTGMPGVAVKKTKSSVEGSAPRDYTRRPEPEKGNKRKRVSDDGDLGPNKKPAIEDRYITKPKVCWSLMWDFSASTNLLQARRPVSTAVIDITEIDSVPPPTTVIAIGDMAPLYRPVSTLQMAPIDLEDDEL
jgi:hypothetical protein